MKNVIDGQYDSNEYPLKRFFEDEIPKEIRDVLNGLSHKNLTAFRGGLAFVYLLNANDYLLKDLDMIAPVDNRNAILKYLKCADIVYDNKNSLNNSVITAFWRTNDEYFKLDILLCDELPRVCEINRNGESLMVVSASYIWRNRIEKIADKTLRKHDNKKTINHFNVARKLSEYLIEKRSELSNEDALAVKTRLQEVEVVLSNLITKNELEEFIKQIIELVRS